MRSYAFFFPLLFAFLLSACGHDRNESMTHIAGDTTSIENKGNKSHSFRKGFADVNGIKMYYEIHGEGKPLVLIHGAGSTIETSFGRIIPALAAYRQVIAVELQAHGHTTDRNTGLSFEQDADDVAALLKVLQVDKADVLGFSNGGNTALQMALRHPEQTDRVVAASTLLKREGTFPGFWDFMKNARLEQMPVELREAYMKITADSSKLRNMHDKCAERMVGFRDMSDEQIGSIKVPVLLINGDADVATPEHTVEMYRLIPNCELAILPGTHGEYMGEVTTLKAGQKGEWPILPLLEKFLD